MEQRFPYLLINPCNITHLGHYRFPFLRDTARPPKQQNFPIDNLLFSFGHWEWYTNLVEEWFNAIAIFCWPSQRTIFRPSFCHPFSIPSSRARRVSRNKIFSIIFHQKFIELRQSEATRTMKKLGNWSAPVVESVERFPNAKRPSWKMLKKQLEMRKQFFPRQMKVCLVNEITKQ